MSLLDSEIEIIDKISVKNLIIEWLEKYRIHNYKINDDYTIDVNGEIDLYGYPESQLPDYIQFNKTSGWFDISCSQIETLKGCPKIIDGYFICSGCPKLKTLEGTFEKVGGDFDCHKCKNLESLKGAPKIVQGCFCCSYCDSLKNLIGSPEIINRDFECHHCKNLESLEGASKIIRGYFCCFCCSNLKITNSDYKKYSIVK